MDQSAGMLSEDVQEKGYCLLCVAMPQTDCDIQVIEEVRYGLLWLQAPYMHLSTPQEELLNEVMVG